MKNKKTEKLLSCHSISFLNILLLIIGAFSVHQSASAGEYEISPFPNWVEPIAFKESTKLPENEIIGGLFYLLIDTQLKVHPTKEIFKHFVIKVTNEQGIENISQILINFDPAFQSVKIHEIKVHRSGKILNRLEPEKISVLQRETELEYQILDGSKTVYTILEDVRKGDIVEYSYSIHGANPILRGLFYYHLYTQLNNPVNCISFQLIWPKERKLFVKNHREKIKPVEREGNEDIVYTIRKEQVQPILPDDELPKWFDPYPWIQFSESASWSDVVKWGSRLYAPNKEIPQNIKAIVNKIKQSVEDPEKRLINALRFIQNEIRYMGVEIGPNSYAPTKPSIVLNRRFGDCKDKSLLLYTILKELGITAYPALVSTNRLHKVAEMHPSPIVFNHAIVQFLYNGAIYWFDPTDIFQRGDLKHLYQPDYGKALVLDNKSTDLVPMNPPRPSEAGKIINVEFDLSKGYQEPAELTITTVYKHENADYYRNKINTENIKSIQKSYLNYYAYRYRSIKIRKQFIIADDPSTNQITMSEYYLIDNFWKDEKEEERSTAYFKASEIYGILDEPETLIRTMPYGISYPLHYIENINIRLPEKKWAITPKEIAIENNFVSFTSNKKLDNNCVRLRYQYMTLQDHVPADKLKIYLEAIKKIKDQLSYRVYHNYGKSSKKKAPYVFSLFCGLCLVLIAVVYFQSYLGFKKKAEQYLHLLHIGEINLFIEETNRNLKMTASDKAKNLLLLNKAAGIFYKGEWFYSLSLLQAIDPKRLSKLSKRIYYSNYFLTLIFADKLNDAKELYLSQSKLLKSEIRDSTFNSVLKSSNATYEYYFGDIQKSKTIFSDLKKLDRPPIHRAVTSYFLGLIYLQEKQIEKAKEYLNQAAQSAPMTFLPDKTQEILRSLE